MPGKKIQDEAEVIRWLEEGLTYQQMSEEYLRKYHLEVSPTMFSNFRARRGLSRRIVRDDELIPWAVKREHRWGYPLAMLRAEARRRAGAELDEKTATRLASWKAHLLEEGAVVHYEPDTDEGWFLVPRRLGIDTDLIREPTTGLTQRRPIE